jgi:hypothetical protein
MQPDEDMCSNSSDEDIQQKVITTFNPATSVAGTVTPLNLISEGPEQWNRIGRIIQLHSLRIHGFVNPATAGVFQRCAVVYDRQPNGVLPASTDIFNSWSNTGVLNNVPQWNGIHPDNSDRFTLVWERFFRTAVVSGVQGDPTQPADNLQEDICLCDIVTVYQASTATIGAISTGALYFVAINTSSTTQVQGELNLRYTNYQF